MLFRGSLALNRARLARYVSTPARHPHSSHLPGALLMASNIIVDRAQGAWVYSTDGRKYLDFTTGIGVTSLGHCHPSLVKAAQEQLTKIIHCQMNTYTHKPMLDLAEALVSVLPGKGHLDQIHFSNSGAEAVENAVKLARHATGKPNIIVFQGGFHGRTLGTSALTTAKTFYRAGFQPLAGGVFVAPFPYCHHCPVAAVSGSGCGTSASSSSCPNCTCASSSGSNKSCSSSSSSCSKCSCASKKVGVNGKCCGYPVQQLRQLLKQQTAPTETAAIIMEPILGEGGYVVPPPGFLQEVRRFCDENSILFIADEVQSGFGRTGKMFAVEHWDVVPDIMVMAKGIASGFPLSAIAANHKVMAKALPGSVGGTYGGNAVSCAAALAVLRTFKEEKILENVQARGEQFMEGLLKLKAKYPISDVRGKGLMVAAEFDTSKDARWGPGVASRVQKHCIDNGLLVLTAGIYDTLRFIPPLIVSKQETQQALDILDKSMASVFK